MSELGASKTPSLNVTFTFAEEWKFGTAGKLAGFPPGGGGGAGVLDIEIAPVNFEGKSAAEIAAIEARRASDMALISQAIAAASVQFSEALAALRPQA
jgi:hypothetical protein